VIWARRAVVATGVREILSRSQIHAVFDRHRHRGGAVAIRLPYGLELLISRRERVAQIGTRRLLKSVTG
jgi:hypothetical protein